MKIHTTDTLEISFLGVNAACLNGACNHLQGEMLGHHKHIKEVQLERRRIF